MVIWYVIIFALTLANLSVCRKGFYDDYLVKERCFAIKGLFIMLVFLGHALTIIQNCQSSMGTRLDEAAHLFHMEMGQLVVVMFLFYSGYGVMRSLLVKGEDYLKSFPQKRLLKTLLNFDVAVLCYLFLEYLAGNYHSASTIALSLIAWEGVGNSHWYIFVILFLFFSFYVVFKIVRANYTAGSLLFTLVAFIGMLALHRVKDGSYWFNTILVFPAGVLYAQHSDYLETFIHRCYWLCFSLLLVVFVFLQVVEVRPLHGLTYNIKSVVFALLIIVLSMKVRIHNKMLVWCGVSLFPLYIYHFLPMNTLRYFVGKEWILSFPHLFIVISFVATVVIAILYNKYFRVKLLS